MRNRRLFDYRRSSVSLARGEVLEIGVGSGLNFSFYGEGVSRVVGIDPSAELLALADRRIRKNGPPVHLVRASAQTLPFRDASFDAVVTTWTLCSVPDARTGLREIRRVLRGNGNLLFAEHGLAPERGVERWQNRLTPCWRCLAGGCHLNRKIDELIRAAGFRIGELHTGYIGHPKIMTFMYQGWARPD